MESKELSLYSQALPPQGLKDFAKAALESGLLPPSIKSPQAAFVIMAAGLELGLKPMQSLRSIHIIEGRPVLSADLMIGLAKQHPECVYFRLVESSPEKATYETERKGSKPEALSWTLEDAKRAQLTSRPNWQRHPAAMLRARCGAALARIVYPDLLLGVYEESEGEEIKQGARLDKEPGRVVEMSPAPNLAEGADKIETYRAELQKVDNLTALKALSAALQTEPDFVRAAVKEDGEAAKKRLKEQARPQSPNPDSAKIPAESATPKDFDKAEEKKFNAREAIQQARDNAQSHPPKEVPTLNADEGYLLDGIMNATSFSKLDELAKRLETPGLCSPKAIAFLKNAIETRKKKIIPPDEGQPQLGDPPF